MSTTPTYDEALRFMSDATLYQRIDLSGPWQGWKLRGQYLVSPDRERIMMRELIGLLIHYHTKFRHSKQPNSQHFAASNVIAFVPAAIKQIRVKKKTA